MVSSDTIFAIFALIAPHHITASQHYRTPLGHFSILALWGLAVTLTTCCVACDQD